LGHGFVTSRNISTRSSMEKQRSFIEVAQDAGRSNPIENFRAALDQVKMTVRHRVKRSG